MISKRSVTSHRPFVFLIKPGFMKQIIKFTVPCIICVYCMIGASFAQNKAKDLDNYFSSLFKYGQFNGNVLVAENGNIIYERSFGYADFSAKKLNEKNTSFAVASITKTFTSTAILQLQEKGKLNVKDHFVKYFPD